MKSVSRLLLSTLALLALVSTPSLQSVMAQSAPQQGEPKDKPDASDRGKEAQRSRDEFAEAAKSLQGSAGQAECVWLGRRIVGLLWRDDIDTAIRHMSVYDRFGCPAGHIQMAFRCVVRQGTIDAKAPESLTARAHACWIEPKTPPDSTATISPGGEATK
jgi:hypothetical protein